MDIFGGIKKAVGAVAGVVGKVVGLGSGSNKPITINLPQQQQNPGWAQPYPVNFTQQPAASGEMPAWVLPALGIVALVVVVLLARR